MYDTAVQKGLETNLYLLVLSFMIMTIFHVATWLAVVPVEELQAVVRHPALLSVRRLASS